MENKVNNWRQIYRKLISEAGYSEDGAQLRMMDEFTRIESELKVKAAENSKKPVGFFTKLWAKNKKLPQETVKGLYAYGGVGQGKTFLMDMFCEHSKYSVRRLHFHHFMQEVHHHLKQIKQQNPLLLVAEQMTVDIDILCLDEFFVLDITDAMLLYGLLQALTNRGIVIITTSNIIPDELYKGGLQRKRFLPAIALIKSELVTFHIETGQDFRHLSENHHEYFISSIEEDSHEQLLTMANSLGAEFTFRNSGQIEINQRTVRFMAKSSTAIWFGFDDLCEGLRSQADYIWLASHYPLMIVSDIPILDEYNEDAARRFLILIDELYDRRIQLILSSEIPIKYIYQGKKMHFEFKRLQSRLFEMQSADYGESNIRVLAAK